MSVKVNICDKTKMNNKKGEAIIMAGNPRKQYRRAMPDKRNTRIVSEKELPNLILP